MVIRTLELSINQIKHSTFYVADAGARDYTSFGCIRVVGRSCKSFGLVVVETSEEF